MGGSSWHVEENVWRGAPLPAKKRRATKVGKGSRKREERVKKRGWELVKESKMSEGGGLKKERRVRRVQKGAFESALIKACVMDRTCGRACFFFFSVCVREQGDGVLMGGARPQVEMSTASSLNGTKT